MGPSTGSKHTRKSLSTRLTQKYSLGIIERTEALLITFTPGERVLLYLLTALFALSSFALVLNASSYISVEVPAPGGSIVEGETGTARFINPLLTLSQADQDISALVYSGLLRSLPDGTLIPDLAEQYEISPDNLTYTFTLKNEVTFHDGSPVTSADVAYTIAQAQNPEIKSTHRADWDKVTVATPDPRTIIFTLPHPYAPFLENMTLGILPKHAWEKIGEKEFSFDALNTNPIGSGPFRVSNVKKDGNGVIVRYELSPFDGFALGKAHLDHITFVFFPNDTALAKALDGEYINAIGGLSPAFLSSLSRKDLSLVRTPLPRVYAVFLNQSKNTALQDVVVRRALNAAVDRQSLIDTVLGGYGAELTGPIPPGIIGRSISTSPIAFSPALIPTGSTGASRKGYADSARTILENGGWSFNAVYGAWMKKKQTLEIKIATVDEPELVVTANFIANAWKAAGIPATVDVYSLSEFNNSVIKTREYDAVLFGEVVGRKADLFAFWHSSQRNAPGLNLAGFANVNSDNVLANARVAGTKAERETLYKQFLTIVDNDKPAIFLFAPDFVYILPHSIRGVQIGSLTQLSERFANVYEWYTRTEKVWSIFSSSSQ